MALIRPCAHCGSLMTNVRKNKKFCSDSCRGKADRRKTNKLAYASSPERLAICVCSINSEAIADRPGYGGELPASSLSQVISNEEARAQFCISLHSKFCNYLKDFLEADNSLPGEAGIHLLIVKGSNLIQLFEKHPFLPNPNNIAHQRLKCLKAIKAAIFNYGKVNITSMSGKRAKKNAFLITEALKQETERHLQTDCFAQSLDDMS